MSERPPWLDDLLAYVELTEDDAANLRAAAPLVVPHATEMSREFYDRIREFPAAEAVFRDEAQVVRLRRTLERWLAETLEGPWDDAYFVARSRIGHVHARIGLEQRFMFGAMSVIRQRIHRIVGAAGLAEARSAALSRSVDKILDVELAVMLETFREALLARVRRSEELERRGVEEELARAEARYRDVIESAEVMVVVLDPAGRAVVWNRKAEELTGWARDEVMGRDPLPSFLPEEEVRRALLAATPSEPRSWETVITTRSGRRLAVRLVCTSSRDPSTGAVQRHLMGVDLTHLREAERRARASEKLAAVGTLAAGLAHEIRNPVNAASLHVTVLERAMRRLPSPPEPAVEATRVLRVELARLSGLVTEFLDFARPTPLAPADEDLRDIVAHAALLLRPQAEAASVELRVEIGEPVRARVDRGRLEQVLINLVRNAIEATTGRDPATVTLHVRSTPRTRFIEVVDDGPGIVDSSRVFDAFFTTKEHGTGLGLAIAHRIVDAHGGSLSVESRPGFTQFTVALPA